MTDAATATLLGPGQVVAGQYRLEQQIGEGGFGAVYRATHLSSGTPVAFKVLRLEALAISGALERFDREAQWVRTLEHPNTVRIFDHGRTEAGLPFMALELLEGDSLESVLRRGGAMGVERVLHIVRQVLQALREAHDKGIVHRDLKPANVFLCKGGGGEDFVKLLDFGIAKVEASEEHSIVKLTQMGYAVGTPAYMAPEQVAGKGVGPATDIYALGLVMAEMLSGKVVVTGTHEAQVALEHLSNDPVPLPPEVLRSALGAVVLKATQKDKRRRHQNVAELLGELEALGTGGGAHAAATVLPGVQAAPAAQGDVSGSQRALRAESGVMNRELQAGDVVGEYTVDRKIGEGSFGKVYAARHPLIGKTVAIKVLNPMFAANADIVERFVTEARAVNEIRHRNIIDIFSFGTLDSGLHYFVMELLEGKTFEDYIRERGKLTPEVALPILKDIAKALEAAHKKGIAHRDLKPENVFLSFDEDGACFPKLLDFGIAKLLGDGPGSHKTATGMPMGTPLYMAPEQCKGTNVDHRADIYAFGIMAHEALSGRRPFDGDSVMEIMMAQIASDPPPLSRHAPMLPATLDGPILQMLAKEPSQRPQTIKQAMDTLLAAQRDAPPSPWEGADAGAETCWPVAPPAPPWGSGAMGAAAVSSAAVSSAAVSSAAVSSAAVSPPAPTLAPTGVSAAAPAAATLEPGYSAAMARVQAQPSTLVSAEPARPSSKVPTALLAGGVALVAVVGLVVAFGLRGTEAAPAAAASASATATASPEPSATAEVALGTTIGGKIPAKGSIVEDEVQAVFRAGFVAQGTPVTMDARQRLHRRISVQAANDWQITEAEVHFPVHTSQVELFRQSGEKLNNEADKDPVEGKSYRVISKDGGLTVTALDGQAVADPERKTVEEEVGLLLQPQPAMFTRPLQVGDEVTPPPALMRFWIGDANKGAFAREGRMTLRSVEQDGDHRLAVFDTTVTYGFDDDDVSVRVAMTGTLSLDVESGLPRVMSLEGPLTGELTVAPGQKVQMTGVMKIARGKPGAVSISLDPAATP